MKLRSYILLAMLAISNCVCADERTWSVKAESLSPTTRAVSLSDLGISDLVTLSDHGDSHEQHFFFAVPQHARLKDVRFDLRAIFLRPFSDDAALSFLVNGVPVSKLALNGGEEGYSQLVKNDGKVLKSIESARAAREIVLSIPLPALDLKKGFVDLAIVFNSRAGQNARDDAVRNTVSIDPKATGLVYSFDSGSVGDARSLLATFPHRPVILLPQSELTKTQYETALRTALALSQKDLQPEFVAIPKVGEIVDTKELVVPDELKSSPIFADFVAAQHGALKLVRPEQIGAWLVLRSLSARGLAQVVVDSAMTGKTIRDAIAALAELKLEKSLISPKQWAIPALDPKANLRIAALAGQPVLLLDEPNMAVGAALLATTWLEVASSRDELLDKAMLYTNDELDKTHFYFPQSQSVKSVAKKAEWVVPFKLADLPQGKWPEAFEINLLSAPTGDRVRPVVSVYLNDNLLVSDFLRSDGQLERITARIPQYSIAASNYLKIEVRRRCEASECAEETQSYPVQVLPSSYLALGGRGDAEQFFMLPPALAHDADVVVPNRYLQDSVQSLTFVQSILSALSARTMGINLVFSDKAEFTPRRTFVTFEVAPASAHGSVERSNGRLTVRNEQGQVVFDGSGLGELAALQLLRSSGEAGVWVQPIGAALPRFSEPLDISQGDLAIVDEHGVKLSLNLADPENRLQLDQQNSDIRFLVSRNRAWLIALVLLLLLVGSLFVLRAYFKRSADRESVK